METITVSGIDAIARGIVDAGVKVVTSYPGGPVTPIVQALIDARGAGDLYVQWSNCEKVAFEVALGCTLSGRRSVMAGKHVGINHILDPLMTVNLTGTGGGMVILAGDDPGAYGSQNEQDSRLLGAFAEIPILEPATPEEGYRMTRQAFRLSEAWNLPVMIRFVADYTTERGGMRPEPLSTMIPARFDREKRWKALPSLVVEDHKRLHSKLARISEAFEHAPFRAFNRISGGGRTGVVMAGNLSARLRSLLSAPRVRVLELGTLFPLPENQVSSFLAGLDQVYVIEEVEPFVENGIRVLVQKRGLKVEIRGKTSGHVPWEGDLQPEKIARIVMEASPGQKFRAGSPSSSRSYPSRRPFGKGCPYTPFFRTLDLMVDRGDISRPVVIGETGCLVRLNNPPFEMLDVKYSMGSSIGIATGLALGGTGEMILAVTGDSAFFHTGLNGLVNAAHHKARIVVAVMDNGTVAMTGFQEPTGSGTTAMGEKVAPIYPEKVAAALNIENVRVVNAFDEAGIATALEAAFDEKGVSFLVVRGPCPYIETRRCLIPEK